MPCGVCLCKYLKNIFLFIAFCLPLDICSAFKICMPKAAKERAYMKKKPRDEIANLKQTAHTVILLDWTLEKWGHSNFGFQH